MTIGFHEIKLEQEAVGKIVTLTFIGKLDKEDYELFVPQLQGLMDPDDKIRLLVELQEFQGWTVGALWEETKFAAKHFNDIERLAIVGESRWEKGMVVFAKPFTTATVRYFDISEMDEAKQWVRES
jgi:hypothetical protein